MTRRNISRGTGWLLFFYSVPAKPVAGRIKVWRRLVKAGAVQLKGAYVLPDNEEHYELFQWLVPEVASMKGNAAFVRAEKIETMTDAELIALFDRQNEENYRAIENRLEDIQRKISAVKNASGTLKDEKLPVLLSKCLKEFEESRKTDFFASTAGSALATRISAMKTDVSKLYGAAATRKEEVMSRKVENYRGRTWATRKRPFIDRMASAWLIRRFVDEKASFGFMDEGEAGSLEKGVVAFDVRGGEFTHVGDLCTFEVMVKSFGLKGKALKAMAEIIHELDVKDGRYNAPEARGIEDILSGIRKTAKDDMEALEKGMGVFDMLYASKS